MFRIQRTSNGDVVLKVAGELAAIDVGELASALAAESTAESVVLDLKELTLVDRQVVRFLQECEFKGIGIRNCSGYIRRWIESEKTNGS
ncbi:MAG TPA: hypothetical protein VGI93_14255 [Steroidobacteraceae bacterium]|jgi:anti-anti-sigma regulatory factor